MSEEVKLTAQELKQRLLDRIDAARKEVENLSDEELEAIVGGRSGDYTTCAVGEDDSLFSAGKPRPRTRLSGRQKPTLTRVSCLNRIGTVRE